MSSRTDGVLAVIAALFVMFTALIDPRFSSGLAVGLLIVFAIYKVVVNQRSQSHR